MDNGETSQRRLEAKWANIDLQKVLDRDGVVQFWNEMLHDSETAGKSNVGAHSTSGIVGRKNSIFGTSRICSPVSPEFIEVRLQPTFVLIDSREFTTLYRRETSAVRLL